MKNSPIMLRPPHVQTCHVDDRNDEARPHGNRRGQMDNFLVCLRERPRLRWIHCGILRGDPNAHEQIPVSDQKGQIIHLGLRGVWTSADEYECRNLRWMMEVPGNRKRHGTKWANSCWLCRVFWFDCCCCCDRFLTFCSGGAEPRLYIIGMCHFGLH